MHRPVQATPRLRRSHTLSAASRAGIRPSLCVTASCSASGQCCASILGQSFCIPNPLPFGGNASCCLEGFLPPKVCCSLNGQQLGCVSL